MAWFGLMQHGDGGGLISIPADVNACDFVILTDEPPMGSEAPTTMPVFDAPIGHTAWP